MAGTVTHTYFAKDVYKKLDKNTSSIIKDSKNSFETFAQGHDIFYFCGLNGKKIDLLFHSSNTQNFFINLINYIRKNKLEYNSEIMAYLYGNICHYALDSILHPYIIYKAGDYNKKYKNTLKYNGKHNEVESYIDAFMINDREKIKPNKLDLKCFCFKYKPLSKDLCLLINTVYKETYNKRNIGKKYKKGLKNMKFLYSLLRNDKNGLKKQIYKFIDSHSFKSMMRFSPISYVYKLNKNHFYLNLDHRKWCHPMYKNEIYSYSFDDLYKQAIDLSLELINASNAVLFYNKTSNYLKRYFKNTSYISGKNCSDKKEFKYFEF